jgi:hypothetical protein
MIGVRAAIAVMTKVALSETVAAAQTQKGEPFPDKLGEALRKFRNDH